MAQGRDQAMGIFDPPKIANLDIKLSLIQRIYRYFIKR